MRRGVGAVAIAVVSIVAAMPMTPEARAQATQATGDPEVTVVHEQLVDTSRPTSATATKPASPERVLETTIAFPARAKTRLPLVVLAHGYNGNPGKFSQLIDAWAAAGYVVAAPQFPLTNDLTSRNGPTGDVVNQPADVSFVIDEMLRNDRQRGNELRKRIDRRHIGVAGLSTGGWTTYGVTFNTCCRDGRIDAAVFMSALRGDFAGGEYDFASKPVLVLHADADVFFPHSEGSYPLLAAPKWYVTLHGGTTLRHATPFEDTPDPADQLVRDATTAFWDHYLKGRKAAEARLLEVTQPADGSATLQHEL